MSVICIYLVFYGIYRYLNNFIIIRTIDFESGEIKYMLFKILEIFS